jgi:hypothetical protein
MTDTALPPPAKKPAKPNATFKTELDVCMGKLDFPLGKLIHAD